MPGTGPTPSDHGLRAIAAEMDRQHDDARRSFDAAGAVAGAIAASTRRTGRLALLGMGGSHAVNRIAEALYRRAGLDATALPVSEALHAPLPPGQRTVLLTSQSGESGEVVAYLRTEIHGEERFGLTLDTASTLARALPSLVGHGGVERAFAATRSLTVSLALHARVIHELGLPQDRIAGQLAAQASADVERAADRLSAAGAVIFSGRGVMQGVAEAAALGLLELARMPSFALEGGQLRHGPLEALGPGIGIVLIRPTGPVGEPAAALARLCQDAGSPTVVIDLSGSAPVAGVVTVALPPAAELHAAFAALAVLQVLIIEIARRRVADVGVPLRSSKVTRDL
jgi:fructoselysine-6-P-deglycase FrlB-like protein